MTFTELVAEVYKLTNRPDLEAETKAAIKAATLKAHMTDFYSKDIFETGIAFSSPAYKQSLDYISLISNFRALKYIRRVEDEFDDAGAFFEVITPEEVLTSYGSNKTDIAYIAGRVVELRASVEFSKALIGCYVLPLTTEENFSSWVASLYPYAIINEATRKVFKTIGYDEQAATYEKLVAEEYMLLKMSAIADVGY